MVQPYWGVDFPGLGKDDAQRIADWARANATSMATEPNVVDPRDWLTMVMDRETVELLVQAFQFAEEATGEPLWANMRRGAQRWLDDNDKRHRAFLED